MVTAIGDSLSSQAVLIVPGARIVFCNQRRAETTPLRPAKPRPIYWILWVSLTHSVHLQTLFIDSRCSSTHTHHHYVSDAVLPVLLTTSAVEAILPLPPSALVDLSLASEYHDGSREPKG